MATNPSERRDDLSGLINDDTPRTEPLEEHFVMIDDCFVAYLGPDKVCHPWSAAEFGARRRHSLIKDRDQFDAVDPHESNLFADLQDTQVEIKSARVGCGDPGRICIKDIQHGDLLSKQQGAYVIVLYEQINNRLVYIADSIRVSAEMLNELAKQYTWSPRDASGCEPNEIRIRWTKLPYFDAERIRRKTFVLDYVI